MSLILPSSACRVARHTRLIDGVRCVQLYCAWCTKASGIWTPEEYVSERHGSPTYFCDPCAAIGKVNELAGQMVVPMEAFERAVAAEQFEQKGRPFSHVEIAQALEDDANPLTKMKREQHTKDWSK